MGAKKVGRNDPCPCGSGKKYKYCCMRKDQRQRRRRVASSPDPQPVQGVDDVRRRVHRIKRELEQNLPDDEEARELREQMDSMGHMMEYVLMQDEIDAAVDTLETYRDDFEEMATDPGAAMDRAHDLFSEEPFADLRFGPDDLERAFEVVGYPSTGFGPLSDEDMGILVAAAIHLAGDEDHRLWLSRRLMMTLPEYVDAGRYRDAWLIEYSAYRLAEFPEESSPFMFVMIELAFEAWMKGMEDQQRGLMEELGLDVSRLKGADIIEIEAEIKRLMEDPRKEAQMEAFYQAHPELRKQAEAGFGKMAEESLMLLERDDAERLFLSLEEVEPWLPTLMDRLESVTARLREAEERGEEPDPEVVQAMQEGMVAVTREMASEVFTPERVDELAAELKAYRRSLAEAGEREARLWAHGGMAYVMGDIPPAENRFLCAVCFASLRRALKVAMEQAAAEG
jgi:hypothetical protein